MDLIDFEKLIDLGANISLFNTDRQNETGSKKSSQEPLADVLDKMCAAIIENDVVMTDPLQGDIDEAEIGTVVDFEESEEKLCEATVGFNLAPDDPIKNDTDDAYDTVVNLEEFEHILAATYISNHCTNTDETDNMVDYNDNKIVNTALKEMIEPVVRHDLPVDSEEMAETFAECASLDEDSKLNCSLISGVDLETLVDAVNVADNEIKYENNLEIAKLEDMDISFNEDSVKIDEIINDCCYEAEEHDNIIGNTTNGKRMKTSMDIDNDIIIISSDSDDSHNSSDLEFITEDEAKEEKSMEGNIVCALAAPSDTNKPSTSNIHINEVNSDSDDGYNSSYFEFITEDEAKEKKPMEGNIACLHAAPSDTNNPSTSNTHINEVNSDSHDSYNSSYFEFITEDEAKEKKPMEGNIACLHAAPSNSNKPTSNTPINEASPSEYIKYSKHRYQVCYAELNSDSEHHVIPEGEEFLDLFRGEFAPAIVDNLHTMTNKSLLPPTPMGSMFDDLRFRFEDQDLREGRGQYTEEAEECARMILSKYPNENRTRRRSRRF